MHITAKEIFLKSTLMKLKMGRKVRMSLKDIDKFNLKSVHIVSNKYLTEQLRSDIAAKCVSGAQWFRDADNWFRINHGYINPINVGCVHSELLHLQAKKKELRSFLSGRMLVFYGIGVGDTEMATVDIQLEDTKYCETILIDVNPQFLIHFLKSLASRKLENREFSIKYLSVHGLFEQITQGMIGVANSQFSRRAIVCLGGTIGNYKDTRNAFEIFQCVAKKGDLLMVSYQLSQYIEEVFLKYRSNDLYRDLIGNFLEKEERERIQWKLNRADNVIEAWLDDVQLFRSRKFETNVIKELAKTHGWTECMCSVDTYGNSCLHLFHKNN